MFRVSQVNTMYKNVQKRAKTCILSTYLSKNVYLKFSYAKNVQKRAKNVQKRASQMFLDPIQKRVSRGLTVYIFYASRICSSQYVLLSFLTQKLCTQRHVIA